MIKLGFIYKILKRRYINIVLLSIMFSSLIVVFMFGFGVKGLFYDYMRSDYGNIPDIKINMASIEKKTTQEIVKKIKHIDKNAHTLTGFEDVFDVSFYDSEDNQLTSNMPLSIVGIDFDVEVPFLIDSQKQMLKINSIDYEEGLEIRARLDGLSIKNLSTVMIMDDEAPIATYFCKDVYVENNELVIKSKECPSKIDDFYRLLDEDDTKIDIKIDSISDGYSLSDYDEHYHNIVIESKEHKESADFGSIKLSIGNMDITKDDILDIEVDDLEIVISLKNTQADEKVYKRYISKILKNYIDYNRVALKLELHAFADDDEDDREDSELVYLNELTDFIDIIFKKSSNLSIASSYLAGDLNNLGVLDDFIVKYKDSEFNLSIRSQIFYNPEKFYDKNILLVNSSVLSNEFGVEDKNNFIYIYSDSLDSSKFSKIKKLIHSYDTSATILTQDEIIPSIKPKKELFDIVILMLAIFILFILLVSMYIVLIQFYSNYSDELSLLKLYGSSYPYQTFINSISFVLSLWINYAFMVYEEGMINSIMLKYFFKSYVVQNIDFIYSALILLVFIIFIYFIEKIQMKKLNLIKGQ